MRSEVLRARLLRSEALPHEEVPRAADMPPEVLRRGCLLREGQGLCARLLCGSEVLRAEVLRSEVLPRALPQGSDLPSEELLCG
jgi:hypothetical protein